MVVKDQDSQKMLVAILKLLIYQVGEVSQKDFEDLQQKVASLEVRTYIHKNNVKRVSKMWIL